MVRLERRSNTGDIVATRPRGLSSLEIWSRPNGLDGAGTMLDRMQEKVLPLAECGRSVDALREYERGHIRELTLPFLITRTKFALSGRHR
jgi:hypothetical protein